MAKSSDMIGVQHHEEGTGEIRRLRVERNHRRRGIGSRPGRNRRQILP